MGAFSIRIPAYNRSFNYGVREFDSSAGTDSNSSDIEFEFLEDEVVAMPAGASSSDESEILDGELDEEKRGKGATASIEESKKFWENQHQLLMSTLYRSSSVESRIRNSVKDALKEIQRSESSACACGRPAAGNCKSCLMREVTCRLQNSGFNSAICRSKWRNSSDVPSGEHMFIDVIENSKKGDQMRIIIELNFRAEFEIARASEEYNQLVQQLPEIFVGKVERLTNVIKILCSAAKKCMKEKKMHLAPWRKQRYMQAKWLGASVRTTAVQPLPDRYSNRFQKPRASMLTVDLLEKMPNMHCAAAVAVV